MAQQFVTIGESGTAARNAINGNFSELYSSMVLPLKLPGVAANTTLDIPANSYIGDIFLSDATGNPTIRIGTTPNGQEILPDIAPGSFSQITLQKYFAADTTLYITITGGGTLNIRIGIMYNFY